MPADTARIANSAYAFMAELIELLGEFPGGRDRKRAEALSERLDGLLCKAREQGAPHTTLAAIRGAQTLLGMAEMRPLPALSIQATGAGR